MICIYKVFFGKMVRVPPQERTSQVQTLRRNSKLYIGRAAALLGSKVARVLFEVPEWIVSYWKMKYLQPHWKNSGVGGARNLPLDDHTVWQVVHLIRQISDLDPTTRLREYCQVIEATLGVKLSVFFIRKVFEDNGWTYVFLN